MDENYNVQNSDYEGTTPQISDETTDIGIEDKGIVTPNDETLSNEDVTRDADELYAQESATEKKVSEPFVSAQYNHKKRDFTKEEAIKYIQKGMHTESLRAKLEYLAVKQGTDVNSLVERIVSAPEDAYRKHLEAMYGKDSEDVEIGMEIYREKQTGDYKKIALENQKEANKNNINERLADEYINLKVEMPDAPEYSELPDSVIIEAAEGKVDLYSAYLRYLHKEKKKIDAAKEKQEAATTASSGKMGKNSGDNISLSEKNFLSGLWGR